MNVDTKDLSSNQIYQYLVSCIVPRPIAWVSTISTGGLSNLAPFSFFTVASCAPPVLTFAHINRRNGVEKDTLRNLRQTKNCVVHIVSWPMAEVMNASSGDYSADISEFETIGIASVPSHTVDALSVRDAPIRLECELREIIEISKEATGGQLVLLNVHHLFVNDAILKDRRINPVLLDAIGKLAANSFSTTRDSFDLKRPLI